MDSFNDPTSEFDFFNFFNNKYENRINFDFYKNVEDKKKF